MSTKLKLLLTLVAIGVTHAFAQSPAPAKAASPGVTVAIFATNHAGKEGAAQLGALEDYITGKVTELNVRVISGETALNAVSSMAPGAGPNALDAQLAESTSAVRLAQTLGATHLLQVSISGFDASTQTIDAYGVKTINEEDTARVTYKILDGTSGASLAADTVKVPKVVQQSANNVTQRSDILNGLLADASEKVAASLKRQLERGRITTSTAPANVSVTFTTELADVYIPDVRINPENTLTIGESKYKVSALAATIEIDGIAVGTAPGKLEVKAGLHKLRVVREGFKPWERTVNFANGQKLNVALEMSEAGYARWAEASKFINDLKNGAKLTDGQVKVLEGQAKALQNSGFKVNTTDGITINAGTGRSLFGW